MVPKTNVGFSNPLPETFHSNCAEEDNAISVNKENKKDLLILMLLHGLNGVAAVAQQL